MNIRLTKDEFHELITTYVIELAEAEGKMISEGTIIHTPVFDDFLMFIQDRAIGKLRMSYHRMGPRSKAKYKAFKKKMESTEGIGITI